MNYRQEVDTLARGLAAVLTGRDRLTGADVDAGVAGFMATVHLLRAVHVDLVGTGPLAPRDLAALEHNPVSVLGRLLHDVPAIPHAAMSDVQSTPALTETGAQWRVVSRSAVLAHHEWTTAQPASRPTGAAARAEIALHARIAEALATTGPSLTGDLRAAGRDTDAARLLTASTSGLHLAAATTRQALRAGAATDLADLADLRPPAPTSVLVIRRPSHLPAGLDRLATLVQTARHLTPQHVQLVARAAAESAQAASTVLRAHGHPRPAEALGRHAELLAAVASTGRTAASITPPDPRPLAQAQQVHDVVTTLRRSVALDLGDAWRAGQAVPRVTRALDVAAAREISRRTWLTPSRDENLAALTWIPVDAVTATQVPISSQLAAATRHADGLETGLALATPARVRASADLGRTAAPRPGPDVATTRRPPTPAATPRRR